VTLLIPILVFVISVISQRFIGDPDVDYGTAIGLALSMAIYGGAVYVYAVRPQK
jgi:hypothetical protein